MEVTALSQEPLAASLFEPPAGYTERKSVAALAVARPKGEGTARVGVVPVTDATGKQIASAEDAEAAHCDYVLHSEVAAVSKSAVGQVTGKVLKIGGMLSRSRQAAPAQDGTEATVRYRLARAGSAEPAVEASASGKNGSALNLRTATQLAMVATPMRLMMRSMGGGGFGMLAPQWMGGPEFGGPDPVMASIFRGLESRPEAPASAELAAVRAALENEAKGVASVVKAGYAVTPASAR